MVHAIQSSKLKDGFYTVEWICTDNNNQSSTNVINVSSVDSLNKILETLVNVQVDDTILTKEQLEKLRDDYIISNEFYSKYRLENGI